MHCKFNCITVKYNGTQHAYLFQNNCNSLLMGIETLYDAKQVKLNRILTIYQGVHITLSKSTYCTFRNTF